MAGGSEIAGIPLYVNVQAGPGWPGSRLGSAAHYIVYMITAKLADFNVYLDITGTFVPHKLNDPRLQVIGQEGA